MPVQMVFMDSRDYMNQKVRSLVAEYSKFLYAIPMTNIRVFCEDTYTLGKSNEEINYGNGPISHSVVILPHTEQRNLSFGVAASMVQTATDVVGHLRLVNRQSLIDFPVLDETEIATTRRFLVHLQSKGGPLMKMYLWHQASKDFYKTVKNSHHVFSNDGEPKTSCSLSRTRNLVLSSMSFSRVFIDKDVQPTIDYFNW
ncbi:Lycopene cyclase-like protein [Raphanus sativus]|nr:Lycopene cyclase-like protein [Raphanus sativus]